MIAFFSHYINSIDVNLKHQTLPLQKRRILPTQPRHVIIQIQSDQRIKLFTEIFLVNRFDTSCFIQGGEGFFGDLDGIGLQFA